MRIYRSIILLILLIGGVQAASAQDSLAVPLADSSAAVAADTLSAAARSDSVAAAYKMEALRQALGGESYQPPPPPGNFQPPDFGKVAFRMALGLAVILALLYVLYLLVKKVRNVETAPGGSGQTIVKLLDSKFLGAGKSLLLVRVGAERVLVIGSYTDGMRTLSEIHGDEARYIMETYDARPVNAAQFSATVDHLLRRFKRDGGGQ